MYKDRYKLPSDETRELWIQSANTVERGEDVIESTSAAERGGDDASYVSVDLECENIEVVPATVCQMDRMSRSYRRNIVESGKNGSEEARVRGPSAHSANGEKEATTLDDVSVAVEPEGEADTTEEDTTGVNETGQQKADIDSVPGDVDEAGLGTDMHDSTRDHRGHIEAETLSVRNQVEREQQRYDVADNVVFCGDDYSADQLDNESFDDELCLDATGHSQPLHEGGSVPRSSVPHTTFSVHCGDTNNKGITVIQSPHARVTSFDDVTSVLCADQCRMLFSCTNQVLSDGSCLGNWAGDETDVSLPPEVSGASQSLWRDFIQDLKFKLLEDPHFERSFQRPSEVKRFDDAALSTSSIPVEDPASILVRNMDATGTPLGPAVPETVELTIEGFPHLSSHEWMVLERMRDVIGEAAVVSLLRSVSPEDQKSAVVSFMHHEIMSSRKQVATPVSSIRTVPLKLDVSPYRGGENEPLSRWFVELDAAIAARQLRDPSQQVLFAMSNLAGRAKSWAYGKRLVDLNCFPSYDHFKAELKKAFEPPQSEFRARAEFLKLRQGRFDLHSYAQRARYLVSSIVDEPIDVPTQVVTFMTGLNDGPIRNQLFREYPKTLDEAIERAMQEEFSIKQAKFHGFASRPMRQSNVAHDGPESMDISYISTPGNERPRNDGKCFCCGKPGHIAWNCKVSLPGRQTTQGARSNNHDRSYGRRFERSPGPKNREWTVGEGPPIGPEKRTVDVVETQDSGPYVHQAHAVSTMSEKSASQTSSLIVHKVHVDGIATPLRALVDTGASSNFVRNEVIVRHGVFVPDANEEKAMIVRLANGSTVKMPKRVVRLAIKCEDFRGEDEFILLDLDDKFDVILGMPWLKRYQPSIDWMNMKISVDKSRDVDLCCTTTDEVVWVHISAEEIPDGPCDIAKKTVSFAIDDEKVRDGVDKSEWKRNRHPSQQDKKKTSKRSFSPRVLSTPDQGASGDDEGSVQAQDIPSEFANIAVYNEEGDVDVIRHMKIENPPSSVEELISLPSMSKKTLERSLARGDIAQVCVIVEMVDEGFVNTASSADADVLDEKTRKERFEEQSWDALKKNPVYALAREYEDIFPDKVPDELPFDRGIRHEIDVLPGAKYCITRQWPLPKEQTEAIDEFFAQRAKAGHVRESKSPHCSPTFCVKKATGSWRIVHAFNKLNDATIPAQTPVPRKDTILDGMVGSTVFSAIDLKDGFYQIRMREDDVPLTAGLKNAPATFNRTVTNALRPLRTFAPSYFDDIFVHSKATNGKSDVDVHLDHLRQVFQVMRENKLYANLKECMFFAPEIPVLGCFVGKSGVRVDPEKVKAIDDWPVPQNVKQLRQWLGLANYLHKYTRNYAALAQPLTQLLKKDVEWKWSKDHQTAFEEVKRSLREAPVLALPNHDKSFHVVCDASDYAIGCALMQHDDEDHERVVSYQSRQLRPAERNYPVHDKELLAMKYSLVKFRVYLLGEERFAVCTDHASLRTAVKTPHLSQRMARWFSFFAEYNFVVHYKPGKTNILADALSRRPDYDPKTKSEGTDGACRLCEDVQAIAVRATTTVRGEIVEGYKSDETCQDLLKYFKDPSDKALQGLPSRTRPRVHRFRVHNV
ncbi:reverse transcriptase, partial [Globisporangium splendens]